MESDFFRFN